MSELLSAVLDRDRLALLDPAARRLELRHMLREKDALDALPLIADRIDGFGVLGSLMREPGITDILVNGHDEVWVERSGDLVLTDVRFDDLDDLLLFVERMLGSAGRRADPSHPIEDARLPDGSRIHVVMPPLGGPEPVVSIRRFTAVAWDIDALVDAGSMSPATALHLGDLVDERASILVAGGTGCGKTTLVNALLAALPATERVVTIEETRELARPEGHHVALVARPPNADGTGEVGLAVLVRAALRMRPDRIVVGEVRSGEAIIAVDALSTGHRGGFLTIHAEDVPGALERLARLAAHGADLDDARQRVRGAIDAVVVMSRFEGRRRVQEVVRT
jgi:pilus assembly protein CpaF